jgi:peptide/nickel transport system permease protein
VGQNIHLAIEEMEKKKLQKKQNQFKDFLRVFCQNKAAVVGFFVLVILVFTGIFAEFIAPEWYDGQDLERTFRPPNRQNIMGTDHLGRDIFSRIVYGARTSLLVGMMSVCISMTTGVLIGSIAGYYGGKTDNVLMRFLDILLNIPGILLAIAIVSALGPGLTNAMIAIGISGIPGPARMIRAKVLSVREREYVHAARVSGCNDLRVVTHHILPNCMAIIIVQTTLGLGGAILAMAGLSFIGLGVQVPHPDWGSMLAFGRRFLLSFPHISIFPGLMVMFTVLAFNLVGDGLRDALDPELN